MKTQQFKIPFGDTELIIETGKMAQLATGALTATWGGTVVLATAVVADEPREGIDFFPLLVDYEERFYAAGKISGSRFIKRENRPSEAAILAARLIDRPLRPLFPKNFRNDVQVVITVLSYDKEHDPAILGIIAASTAVMLTHAPFNGPVAAARIGLVGDKMVVNPTQSQLEKSKLDLVVAVAGDKVMMIEAGANEVDEKTVLEAIALAKKTAKPLIDLQQKMAKEVSRLSVPESDQAIHGEISKIVSPKELVQALMKMDKAEREQHLARFERTIYEQLEGSYKLLDLKTAFGQLVEKHVRKLILEKNIRPDGRKLDEIRPISIEVEVLPRTHGSALFSRGQTQCLTIVTLGAPGEEQFIDTMEEETTKRYMHHYNFPPYSTGEIKPMRGASRREIGHGALAERALLPVTPPKEQFPYTIRLVSEVLTSNGSSSMAATCGSTLALMDAGVPITKPVAGIAIGLVNEGKKIQLLTDIQGIEDFGGDMDFKVAGTKDGITAIQLDIKIDGLSDEILATAFERAKKARLDVLAQMAKILPAPRKELSPYAPRIYTIKINPEKIGEVIGPGGKVIRKIIEDAGGPDVISIDIEDDGTVLVSSVEKEAADKAIAEIETIVREIEVGEVFTAPVVDIVRSRQTGQDVGAVVQLTPKKDGMIHISELEDRRVEKVSDVVKPGDVVTVKVIGIDPVKGRISLSKKQAGNH